MSKPLPRKIGRSLKLGMRILRSQATFASSRTNVSAYLRLRRSDDQPIFIGGCGHTGTTLLRTILGCHSQIYGVPYESQLFVPKRQHTSGLERWSELLKRQPMQQLLAWQTEAHTEHKARFVEKTPRHLHSIDIIRRLVPRAPIILVTRNPLDVTASLMRRGLAEHDAVDRWVEDSRATLDGCCLPNVLMVTYEEFVEDPPHTIQSIFGFLQLSHEPSVFDYHTKQQSHGAEDVAVDEHASHVALRSGQINSPIFDGRGSWESTLSPAQATRIRSITSDLAGQLNNHAQIPIERRATPPE